MGDIDKVRAESYRAAFHAAFFSVERQSKAEELIKELDRKLTDRKISSMTAATGGVKIVWNKRLTKTAGLTRAGRESKASSHATIELSPKILDDDERLRSTVAHEFCHVADILVGGSRRGGHGRGFRDWAAKCERVLGIGVCRTHDYTPLIRYEYIWTCMAEDCGEEVGRHSKSIDPVRDRCRRCGGVLVQTNPVARTLASRRDYWDHGAYGLVAPGGADEEDY